MSVLSYTYWYYFRMNFYTSSNVDSRNWRYFKYELVVCHMCDEIREMDKQSVHSTLVISP